MKHPWLGVAILFCFGLIACVLCFRGGCRDRQTNVVTPLPFPEGAIPLKVGQFLLTLNWQVPFAQNGMIGSAHACIGRSSASGSFFVMDLYDTPLESRVTILLLDSSLLSSRELQCRIGQDTELGEIVSEKRFAVPQEVLDDVSEIQYPIGQEVAVVCIAFPSGMRRHQDIPVTVEVPSRLAESYVTKPKWVFDGHPSSARIDDDQVLSFLNSLPSISQIDQDNAQKLFSYLMEPSLSSSVRKRVAEHLLTVTDKTILSTYGRNRLSELMDLGFPPDIVTQ